MSIQGRLDRQSSLIMNLEARLAEKILKEVDLPIPMILPCPKCGLLHVDAPDPEKGWTNPPHRSHLCHGCGTIWRPASVETTGVAKIESRGKADTWPG